MQGQRFLTVWKWHSCPVSTLVENTGRRFSWEKTLISGTEFGLLGIIGVGFLFVSSIAAFLLYTYFLTYGYYGTFNLIHPRCVAIRLEQERLRGQRDFAGGWLSACVIRFSKIIVIPLTIISPHEEIPTIFQKKQKNKSRPSHGIEMLLNLLGIT